MSMPTSDLVVPPSSVPSRREFAFTISEEFSFGWIPETNRVWSEAFEVSVKYGMDSGEFTMPWAARILEQFASRGLELLNDVARTEYLRAVNYLIETTREWFDFFRESSKVNKHWTRNLEEANALIRHTLHSRHDVFTEWFCFGSHLGHCWYELNTSPGKTLGEQPFEHASRVWQNLPCDEKRTVLTRIGFAEDCSDERYLTDLNLLVHHLGSESNSLLPGERASEEPYRGWFRQRGIWRMAEKLMDSTIRLPRRIVKPRWDISTLCLYWGTQEILKIKDRSKAKTILLALNQFETAGWPTSIELIFPDHSTTRGTDLSDSLKDHSDGTLRFRASGTAKYDSKTQTSPGIQLRWEKKGRDDSEVG